MAGPQSLQSERMPVCIWYVQIQRLSAGRDYRSGPACIEHVTWEQWKWLCKEQQMIVSGHQTACRVAFDLVTVLVPKVSPIAARLLCIPEATADTQECLRGEQSSALDTALGCPCSIHAPFEHSGHSFFLCSAQRRSFQQLLPCMHR